MRIESATEAKNRFGQVIDAALREPVVIRRSGRKAIVMLAYEDYQELVHLADKLWGERAQKAKGKGFVGSKKSERLLNKLLDED